MSENVARLGLSIDSTGAKTGRDEFVRAGDDIKKKAKEVTDAVTPVNQTFKKAGEGIAAASKSGRDEFVRSANDIKRSAKDLVNAVNPVEAAYSRAVGVMTTLALKAAAVFGIYKFSSWIKGSIDLAARYQELGVVLTQLAASSGESVSSLNGVTNALQKQGISMLQARQTVISFIQARLSLANAEKLAAVAQNAAVTAGLNSSETLQRIVHGITSSQIDVLRTVGLNVTWEQSYRTLAAQLHKNANDLTAQEKIQARVNAVMAAGIPIAGAYEAAMTTAGKQLRSMQRYVEDLRVRLGTLFQPAYTAGVFAMAEGVKAVAHNIDTLIPLAAAFATRGLIPLVLKGKEWVTSTYEGIVAERARLAAASEAAALQVRYAAAQLAIAKANAIAAVQDQLSLVDRAAALSGLTAAQIRYTAAVEAANIAVKEQSVLAKGLGAVISGLGGVWGIALMAVTYVMVRAATQQLEATKYANAHTSALEEMRKKILEVNDAQEKGAKGGAAEFNIRAQIEETTDALKKMKAELGSSGGFTLFLDWKNAATQFQKGGFTMAYELEILKKQFLDGKISAVQYANAIGDIGNRYPQFYKLVKSFQDQAIAIAAGEKDLEGLRDKVAAVSGAFGDWHSHMAAVTKDMKPMSEATREALEQIGTIQAKASAIYSGGKVSGERFDAANNFWKQEKENLTKAGQDANVYAKTYAEALKSTDPATRDAVLHVQDLAQQLVRANRSVEAYSTALEIAKERTQQEAESWKKAGEAIASSQRATTQAATTATLWQRVREKAAAAAAAGQDYWQTFAAGKADLEAYLQEQDRSNEIAQATVGLNYEAARAVQNQMNAHYRLTDQLEKERQKTEALEKLHEEAVNRQLKANVPAAQLTPQQQADRNRQNQKEGALAAQIQADFENAKRIGENFVRSIQDTIDTTFQDIFDKGFVGFEDFFKQIYKLFLKLIADMVAAAVTSKLKNVLANLIGGAFDSQGGFQFKNKADYNTTNKIGQYAGIAVGAAGAGYGIGYGSGNKLTGALGGAAAGAGLGYQLGGVYGAIAGGVIGTVAGLFGASKKAKEAAKAMAEAQKTFAVAFDAYVSAAKGTNSAVADALRQNTLQQQDLIKQANQAYGGKKNETKRNNYIDQINDASAQNAQRIKDEYKNSIDEQINALKGLSGLNDFNNISKQYEENVKNLIAAGGDLNKADELRQLQLKKLFGEMSDQDFTRTLAELPPEMQALAKSMREAYQNADDLNRVLTEQGQAMIDDYRVREARLKGDEKGAMQIEYELNKARTLKEAIANGLNADQIAKIAEVLDGEFAKALSDLADEAARASKAFDDDLRVRMLAATGHKDDAETLRTQIDHENELAEARKNGMTDAQIATLKFVQSLEDLAAAQEKATKVADAQKKLNDDLNVRFLDASGKTNEAEQLRLKLQQEEEYRNAKDSGIDEDTLKRLLEIQSMETAKLLAGQTGAASAAASSGGPAGTQSLGVAFTEVSAGRLIDVNMRMAGYLERIALAVERNGAAQSGGSRIEINQNISGSFNGPPAETGEVVGRVTADAVDKRLGFKLADKRLLSGNASI